MTELDPDDRTLLHYVYGAAAALVLTIWGILLIESGGVVTVANTPGNGWID